MYTVYFLSSQHEYCLLAGYMSYFSYFNHHFDPFNYKQNIFNVFYSCHSLSMAHFTFLPICRICMCDKLDENGHSTQQRSCTHLSLSRCQGHVILGINPFS